MRQIALGFVLLGLAVAWLTICQLSPVESGAASPQPSAELVDHKSSQWVEELAHGARIEVFRSEAKALDGMAKPAMAIQSIGKLDAKELDRLRRSVAPESNTRAVLKAQSLAEQGGRPADYAAFLLELAATEKFRAATAMIDKGEYLLLPRGTELPPLPDDYLLLQVLGFRREPPAEPCDVHFLIRRRDYPVLDHTWSAYSECLRSVHDDESLRFNEMPLEARIAAIAAHDSARAQIGKAEDKLSVDLNAVRMALIPGRFVVDRTTNTIWVRPVTRR
jgi:hypothetical protein